MRSSISSTRLLGSKKARRRVPASHQLEFLGPGRREGEIQHLVNSTSWVQEDEETRSSISSTRILGSRKTRRRDPTSRQLDFLGPRRRRDEIQHFVNSTYWIQEDEETRSSISSTPLHGSKKTKRRDPAFRQLDFLGPRRRRDEIQHFVNSTSLVQEDEETRSSIRQLDFLGPRRRRDEIRHFVNPTSWVQEDEETRSSISSTRLLGSKKTKRRDPAFRQLDFLGPRRRRDEIQHFVNSTSWVQEDEETRSGISSTPLHGSKKTKRRDPAFRQLDFLGPRRRRDEIQHFVNSTSWVQEFLGPRRRRDEIRHFVNPTSWFQEVNTYIRITVLGSKFISYVAVTPSPRGSYGIYAAVTGSVCGNFEFILKT